MYNAAWTMLTCNSSRAALRGRDQNRVGRLFTGQPSHVFKTMEEAEGAPSRSAGGPPGLIPRR